MKGRISPELQALLDSGDDLVMTTDKELAALRAERDTLRAKVQELREALRNCADTMHLQEGRENETIHIASHAFAPLWLKAKETAWSLANTQEAKE